MFQTRTQEAGSLFEERRRDRLAHPENYPDLLEVCPTAFLLTDAAMEITQIDSLRSDSFLYYFAPSLRELERLKEKLPAFSRHGTCVIDSSLKFSGVYSRESLGVRKGFKVFSSRNLCLAGAFILKEHNIWFESINSMGAFSPIRTEQGGIRISSGGSLLLSSIIEGMEKPHNMPSSIWQAFKEFVRKCYGLTLCGAEE